MNADALRREIAALDAAATALRARPAERVVAALGATLERFRDANAPERQRLEAALPRAVGFSAPVVQAGLERALAPWTADAFAALAERELHCDGVWAKGAASTAVILAGSLPMPSLLGMLAPLAARSPTRVKPASRDPLTPTLVAEALAAVDPDLARALRVTPAASDDEDAMGVLLEAACVVATGSDATVDAIAARIAPSQRLLRHGHKLSLAWLGPEATGAELARAAAGLAVDVCLWDQLGCLSPLAIFVAGDTDACQAVGAALGEALDHQSAAWPRGAVPADAQAAQAHERANAELRAAAEGRVALFRGDPHPWTVVCEADLGVRPAPLYRFVRVHPLGDTPVETALAPYARHLAGVALAGHADPDTAEARMRALGASWVCAPGQLQAPPLEWPRGGMPVLGSLVP
ncbi:MAG: acyl-CoA reductase [Myxococcota bacterium]